VRRDVDFLFFETLKSVERNFSQQVGFSEGRKQKERAEVWCDDEEKNYEAR
jgi:hypothetical protein